MGAHSKYSPSGRYRWSACPGSIALTEAINPPEETSVFASEGIVAHAEAAECLLNDKIHIDRRLMTYIDYVRELPGAMMIEQELAHPNYDYLHGTPDALVYDFGGMITIIDLKWGEGVIVSAAENPQLEMYAWMALANYPDAEGVNLVIVQPRADTGESGDCFSLQRLRRSEVMAIGDTILREIHAAQQPNAPLAAGRHCQFCPVKPHCPVHHGNTQLAAGFRQTMPAPEALSPDQLAWLLQNEAGITKYLKSVWSFALNQALAGNPPPGWKAVEKMSNRFWEDEKKAIPALKKLGLKLDDIAPRALVSPAQAEALGVDKKWVNLMVSRKATGYRLAPDDGVPGVFAIDVFQIEEEM